MDKTGRHELILHNGDNHIDWMPGFTQVIDELAASAVMRPISAAWAESLQTGRLQDKRFATLLEHFRAGNPSSTPSEAQRRLLSAEQHALLTVQRDDKSPFPAPYPSAYFANPKAWAQVFEWLQETPEEYGIQYETNLVERDLTTTVSQRTVTVRFLSRVLSHLLGRGSQWASCGPGDMSGDRRNWLSTRDEKFNFDEVDVGDMTRIGGLAISGYKSDIFNGIVREPDNTERTVGLDRIDPTLSDNRAWARSCLTPEEIWHKRTDELHDKIMNAFVPSDRLTFRLADVAKRADMRAVVEAEGVFNGASALLSWYQGSSAEERRRYLLNMRDVLAPGGIIVIADFARTVADNTFLAPNTIWRAPTVYVGYEGKLHAVMSATSGRFRSVRVLSGLLPLAKGGPYEKQVTKLLA